MPLFTGIQGVIKEINSLNCGIDGEIREIKSLYCGKDGAVEQVFSPETTGDHAEWEFTTNATHTLITKYIGTKNEITIPAILNGKATAIQRLSAADGIFRDTVNYGYSVNASPRILYEPGFANAYQNSYYMESFSGKIPWGTTNMVNSFRDCHSLKVWNSTIPESVTDISFAFAMTNMECPYPVIPKGVTRMDCVFYGLAVNMTGDVYIYSENVTNARMIVYPNNSRRLNVHIKPNCITNNTIFSVTNTQGIVGRKVTWVEEDGYYYDEARNVYVYYDL